MKLRRVYPLFIGFVVVPAALMLTVGILILVFGSQARDYVFGTLILALVGTTFIGVVATLVVLYREATVARLQTDFVNKVSHDLRTPLTSIRMFVETLQLGRLTDPERQREALEIIANETARLSTLIARLLDWARMESGKRSYEFEVERVEPIVDAALRAIDPQRMQTAAEVVRDAGARAAGGARRPGRARGRARRPPPERLQVHRPEKRIVVGAAPGGPDGGALGLRQRPRHPRASTRSASSTSSTGARTRSTAPSRAAGSGSPW